MVGTGVGFPKGYYVIRAEQDDTGTAGFNSIKANLDPRYLAVVSHMGVQKTQATVAAISVNARLTETQAFFNEVAGQTIAGINPSVGAVFVPSLELVEPARPGANDFVESIVNQAAIGDTHFMRVVIYCWDINARQTASLGEIFGSIGGRFATGST